MKRKVFNLDFNWRFHLGDIEIPSELTRDSYSICKSGAIVGPAGKCWDDSSWRVIDIPHDYFSESEFFLLTESISCAILRMNLDLFPPNGTCIPQARNHSWVLFCLLPQGLVLPRQLLQHLAVRQDQLHAVGYHLLGGHFHLFPPYP